MCGMTGDALSTRFQNWITDKNSTYIQKLSDWLFSHHMIVNNCRHSLTPLNYKWYTRLVFLLTSFFVIFNTKPKNKTNREYSTHNNSYCSIPTDRHIKRCINHHLSILPIIFTTIPRSLLRLPNTLNAPSLFDRLSSNHIKSDILLRYGSS